MLRKALRQERELLLRHICRQRIVILGQRMGQLCWLVALFLVGNHLVLFKRQRLFHYQLCVALSAVSISRFAALLHAKLPSLLCKRLTSALRFQSARSDLLIPDSMTLHSRHLQH